MKRVSIFVSSLTLVLVPIVGCSSNNEAAEAACIARGGDWNRAQQQCWGSSADREALNRILNPPEKPNNQAAEAACVARGDMWIRSSQMCL
jgi:ABC-type phosphate/phosphonate transport system substrate-binding protein